jgi:hypothetical protein
MSSNEKDRYQKPTSGERIADFMAGQTKEPQRLWLEVWFVPAAAGLTWRVSEDMTGTDNKKEQKLWKTYHRLSGKQYEVVVCSQWKIPLDLSIQIADDVVKGRTVRHELILE